jgi:hypothetical protein
MEINRNQYFLAGLVLILLGMEFRNVESFVLTPECTRFFGEKTNHPMLAATNTMETLIGSEPTPPSKTLRPPESVGWGILSLGAVLVLHSLAMKKPGT